MNKKTLLALSLVISASVFGGDGVPSLVDFTDAERISMAVNANRIYTEGLALSIQEESRLTMQIARFNGLQGAIENRNVHVQLNQHNRENPVPPMQIRFIDSTTGLSGDLRTAFTRYLVAQDLNDDMKHFLRTRAGIDLDGAQQNSAIPQQ